MTGPRSRTRPAPKPKGFPESVEEIEEIVPGFLSTLDGRSRLVRGLRANFDAIVEDAGGSSDISYIRRSLIERFVILEAMLGDIEQDLAIGSVDREKTFARWTQACNALIGLSKTIGLGKRSGATDWLDALTSDDDEGTDDAT